MKKKRKKKKKNGGVGGVRSDQERENFAVATVCADDADPPRGSPRRLSQVNWIR